MCQSSNYVSLVCVSVFGCKCQNNRCFTLQVYTLVDVLMHLIHLKYT